MANRPPIMLNYSREAISLNPAAPPFTYTQHKGRSTSYSSSSATSSSGTSMTTQTSQSTIHSTRFSFPPGKFNEFIPRHQSILTFHATKIPLTTGEFDSSRSETSESQFSGGLDSPIPSDTTFTTQEGTKPEDLLLSMQYLLLQADI